MEAVIETSDNVGYVITDASLNRTQGEDVVVALFDIKPCYPGQKLLSFEVRYRSSYLARYPLGNEELLNHAKSEIAVFLEGDEGFFTQLDERLFTRIVR